MAEEEAKTENEEESEAPAGKRNTLIIIIASIIALCSIAAGVFLAMSNSSSSSGAASGEAGYDDEEVFDEGNEIVLPGAILPLDTFIVNLQVKGSFLKTTVQLEFAEPELPPTVETDIPRVRDTIIRVLSRKSSSELLSPEGKDNLNQELLEAVNEALGAEDVIQIYFTEFIIQ